MSTFLELEGGNIAIALFFLLIALIVATREFVSKDVKKFVLFATIAVFTILIAGHYIMTTNRMQSVKKAFEEGKEVECESRANRKAAQSVMVSKKLGWVIKDSVFSNPDYERKFHSSRCILKLEIK